MYPKLWFIESFTDSLGVGENVYMLIVVVLQVEVLVVYYIASWSEMNHFFGYQVYADVVVVDSCNFVIFAHQIVLFK